MSTPVAVVAEQLRRRVPGGIGTYTRGLLLGLGRLPDGQRPAVSLVASRAGPGPDPLRGLGYPVRAFVLPAPVLTRLWDLGLLGAGRPGDLVHCVSMAVPARGRAAGLVATVHDLAWRAMPDAYPERGRRWHEAALRRVAARADAVVVPSEQTAAALREARVGIGEDRIVTVPEGADHLEEPDFDRACRLLEGLGVEGPYLLAVSTLEPRKNLRRLIEAYAAARDDLAEPWPLVVVGPTGWGESLPETAPPPGVVLAGAVDGGALTALYRGARCCAYVPLLEGFGLPVVEAMSQGTPVVSSPVPSAGGAALEVDPREPGSIAAGLIAASGDGPLRSELIEGGRARAASLLWADAARAHVALWEGVARRAGGAR